MENNKEKKENLRILSFYLNERVYSIPVNEINEVNRIANIFFIEKGPKYLLGLINLHGTIVPVLDLKKVLKIKDPIQIKYKNWINVKIEGVSVCLAVDKLSGFINLGKNDFEKIPSLPDTSELNYIKYFYKKDNELIPVLNINNFLSDIEKNRVSEITESPGSCKTELPL